MNKKILIFLCITQIIYIILFLLLALKYISKLHSKRAFNPFDASMLIFIIYSIHIHVWNEKCCDAVKIIAVQFMLFLKKSGALLSIVTIYYGNTEKYRNMEQLLMVIYYSVMKSWIFHLFFMSTFRNYLSGVVLFTIICNIHLWFVMYNIVKYKKLI